MTTRTNLGGLGHALLAELDEFGAVANDDLTLDWWIGADDRWHFPADEVATHQRRVGPAPVFETTVRVPGGEVAHRAYGAIAAAGAVVVVEIENRTPAPLTVGLALRIARRGRVELDGTRLLIDGRPALILARAPGAWAAGAALAEIVTSGSARMEAMDALEAPTELALLFPVTHRTALRVALPDAGSLDSASGLTDVRALPDADAIARGWEIQLERGLQATLPSPIGDLVDGARIDLLLSPRPTGLVVAALEDWGFDDEAASGWAGLGWRARRAARRRVPEPVPWAAVRAIDAAADPAQFLSALRSTLVSERSGAIDVLPGFPPEWLGQSVTVDGLPLREGSLSFALRWHGARPALLWDAPEGVVLRAPTLDPAWSTTEAVGETLLAEPPTSLLPMGTQERSTGEPVEAPGQFS